MNTRFGAARPTRHRTIDWINYFRKFIWSRFG